MRTFALTYPQLVNQATALDRAAGEIETLARTCAFAERMSDGLYRAQRVPLSCHLVRTASILLAEREPCAVVQAGLLHAAPLLHRFDRSRRRPPSARPDPELTGAFGVEVEELVREYGRLDWSDTARPRHLETLRGAPPRRRAALAIRIANELEELLDGAVAYAHRRDAEAWRTRIDDTVRAAEELDRPRLAAELREALQDLERRNVPPALRSHGGEGYELPRRHWREATFVERAARRVLRAIRGGD